MTPSESLNMAYKFIARAIVCLNYTAGTTKPLLVAELEAALKNLEDVKKENAALNLRIEEMAKAAEDDRVKASDQLKESQQEVASLKLFVDALTLDLQTANTANEKLAKDNTALITERDNLAIDKISLEEQVCKELELGFTQGIAQCHYFFKTPLEHPDFDIMKVFMNRELIDLSDQVVVTPEEDVIPTQGTEAPTNTSTMPTVDS